MESLSRINALYSLEKKNERRERSVLGSEKSFLVSQNIIKECIFHINMVLLLI